MNKHICLNPIKDPSKAIMLGKLELVSKKLKIKQV